MSAPDDTTGAAPPEPSDGTAADDPGAAGAEAPRTIARYEIVHETRFAYSEPVTLDQLIVRLQPRTDVHQRLVRFAVELDPLPSRHTTALDLHGNVRHWFWFERSHTQLALTTRSVVDCFCENPFDFIIVDPGVERVPATYQQPVRDATRHYRDRGEAHPAVDRLVGELLAEHEGATVPFLLGLATRIHRDVKQTVRPRGEPWSPDETLERGAGACRDTAVLFMDAARAAGLAARFVSGYAYDALDPERRELHAWAEVYLPGAGWRGFDPAVGLATANRHVAVAASPTPGYAAPTSGTFTAPPVESSLTYRVEMTRSERPVEPLPDGTVYLWR